MATLEYQAELTKAAAEKRFALDAGLSTPRLPDFGKYTNQPLQLLTD